MRKHLSILSLGIAILLIASAQTFGQSGQKNDREYKIKAAFLYNFLKTIEWPQEHEKNKTPCFVIGIIGNDEFDDATTASIEKKLVKNKMIRFQRFPSLVTAETESQTLNSKALRACHLLFVSRSETSAVPKILEAVKTAAVVTVGESDNFLEMGGLLNFLPSAKKGEFEINLIRCHEEELTISSKLLRIAQRVIQKEE